MMKKTEIIWFSRIITLLAVVILLSLLSYLSYMNHEAVLSQRDIISSLNHENMRLQENIENKNLVINEKSQLIETQETEITSLNQDIDEFKTKVKRLEKEIAQLNEEITLTKDQLQETSKKYEEAKQYQDRVKKGQNLFLSYDLLGDYNDYATPIILSHLGLQSPATPKDNSDLWNRGRQVYNWLSNNYEYCGDKGLRVGTTFSQFQFFSPDELLKSDNARCGDCDDFATLFAGLMYASGVPEDKVWVVCGTLGCGRGHCWNWIILDKQAYRVDPVCSQRTELLNILGVNIGFQKAYYSGAFGNVDCFSEYKADVQMNPDGFTMLS